MHNFLYETLHKGYIKRNGEFCVNLLGKILYSGNSYFVFIIRQQSEGILSDGKHSRIENQR